MDLPQSFDKNSLKVCLCLSGFFLLYLHFGILNFAFSQAQSHGTFFAFLTYLPSLLLSLLFSLLLLQISHFEQTFHLGAFTFVFMSTLLDFRLGVSLLASTLVFFFVKTFVQENIEIHQSNLESRKPNQHLSVLKHNLAQAYVLKTWLIILTLGSLWLTNTTLLAYFFLAGEKDIIGLVGSLVLILMQLFFLSQTTERKISFIS